jgi:hypothetical protein
VDVKRIKSKYLLLRACHVTVIRYLRCKGHLYFKRDQMAPKRSKKQSKRFTGSSIRMNEFPDKKPEKPIPRARPRTIVQQEKHAVPPQPPVKKRETPPPVSARHSSDQNGTIHKSVAPPPPVLSRHTGAPPHRPFTSEIPSLYHETYLRTIPRGPHHIFSFWELGPEALQKAGEASPGLTDNAAAQPVLRLYSIDPGGKRDPSVRCVGDIPLAPETRSLYIRVPESGRTYRLDIGVMTSSGRYLTLCQSNDAATPRARVQDVRVQDARAHTNPRAAGRRSTGSADTRKLIDFSLRSGKTVAETEDDRRPVFTEFDEVFAVEPENGADPQAGLRAGQGKPTASSWNVHPPLPAENSPQQ